MLPISCRPCARLILKLPPRLLPVLQSSRSNYFEISRAGNRAEMTPTMDRHMAEKYSFQLVSGWNSTNQQSDWFLEGAEFSSTDKNSGRNPSS